MIHQTRNDMLKALIVDDEIDICYLLSSILRQKKVETSFVNNLADAARFLDGEKPDILFLDNYLPDGRGIEFIQHIRQLYPSIYVVMITAHDTMEDRSKAYTNGADFFIAKPFTRDVIQTILQKLN